MCRKVLHVLLSPPLSPEVTLLAAKMLFAQTQRITKLDFITFDLVHVVSRLLGEMSAMSQCSACFVLLAILIADDGTNGSLNDLLIELKIPRSLSNLLVLEEDNLSVIVQVGESNLGGILGGSKKENKTKTNKTKGLDSSLLGFDHIAF